MEQLKMEVACTQQRTTAPAHSVPSRPDESCRNARPLITCTWAAHPLLSEHSGNYLRDRLKHAARGLARRLERGG